MAAMRSALMGLCRRRSASWAAASMGGGRGFAPASAPAAARTPALPSLRPGTVRKLEGGRRFSTEGMKGADQDNKPLLMKLKAECILRMWRQRSRGSVKNSYEDYIPMCISRLALQQRIAFSARPFLNITLWASPGLMKMKTLTRSCQQHHLCCLCTCSPYLLSCTNYIPSTDLAL